MRAARVRGVRGRVRAARERRGARVGVRVARVRVRVRLGVRVLRVLGGDGDARARREVGREDALGGRRAVRGRRGVVLVGLAVAGGVGRRGRGGVDVAGGSCGVKVPARLRMRVRAVGG